MEKIIKPKPIKSSMRLPLYELLVVVVNRGKGEVVSQLLKKVKVTKVAHLYGMGTANSAIANLLNLYDKEKEVVFTVIKLKESTKILNKLEEVVLMKNKNTGIAFTIPLKSMTKDSINIFN